MTTDPAHSRSPETNPAHVPYEGSARRGFFVRFLTGAIAVVLGAVPATLGFGFFLDPLLRKRRAGGPPTSGDQSGAVAEDASPDADGFLKLDVGLSSLPEDGTPVAYKVQADKVDAWNRFQNVDVGTVWLRRVGPDQVVAFNAVCPHLGCAVDYRPSNQDFFCPCHTSAFDLDGDRLNQIPPRGMDALETRLKPQTGDIIWLRYQNYRAGTAEKIPIA